MSTLDVALRVRLINELKGAGNQVARELGGIKTAAKGIENTRAAGKLKRDIQDVATASRQAGRNLSEVRREATGLGHTRGPDRLRRDLLDTAAAARQAERALQGASGAAGRLKERRAHDGARPSGGTHGGAAGNAGGGPVMVGGTPRMVSAAGAVYLGYRTASAGVRSVVDQDKAWAEVRKKVEGTPEQLKQLDRQLREMARQYGLSIAEAFQQAAEAGAAGIGIQDVPEAVRMAMAGSVAWDTNPRETMRYMMQTRAAMNWTMAQVKDWADKVNAIADASAVTERDLVSASQRAFAPGKAAGVDPDTVLAITGGQMAGGMPDEVASRWFGAFASRLAGAAAGTDKQQEALKKYLGIDPKVLAAGMEKDARGTILEFLRKFQALKQQDKIAFGVHFFGQEWWDETARATNVIGEILKNIELLNDKSRWSGSMDKSLEIQLSTIASHWERIKTAASEVADQIDRSTRASQGFRAAAAALLEMFDEHLKRRQAIADKIEEIEKRPLTPGEIKDAEQDRLGPAVKRRAERRQLERRLRQAEAELARAEADVARGAPATWQGRGRPTPGAQPSDVERLKAEIQDLRSQLERLKAPPQPLLRGPATPVPSENQSLRKNYTPLPRPLRDIIPETAAEQARAAMQGVATAIEREGEKAVEKTRSITERIKALLKSLDVTVSPTISPRLNMPAAPGAGVGGGASTGGKSSSPAGGQKQSARGGVVIAGPVHVHGVRDLAGFGREMQRRADREVVEARDRALHDTGRYG